MATASTNPPATTDSTAVAAPADRDDAFARVGAEAISHADLFERDYPAHLKILGQRLEQQLEACHTDTLVLTAGAPANHLFDDQPTSFRANPHLRQWLPLDDCSDAALILEPGTKPRLLFVEPADYWHLVAPAPDWAQTNLRVESYPDPAALQKALDDQLKGRNHIALVGPASDRTMLSGASYNPTELLAMLDFDRGCKTAFEQNCMTLATRRAVAGHCAAARAFASADVSEFDVHCAYLQASLQTESDLPYGNIVALNEHGSVLHYQHQSRSTPNDVLSLLIDAGARSHGYASDITRSYARSPGPFADLIEALDKEQLALIETITTDQAYLDLHIDMHRRIARLLTDCGLLLCSADEAFDQGLTETFLPHGLGHLIGLQTHDVAGQSDRGGHTVPPPEQYAALRMTRRTTIDQVFTIEPGIYFIDLLLAPLLAGPNGKLVDQTLLNTLKPYGGIRIEDNVTVQAHGVHNATRVAFAEQAVSP
ncbi:MAG: Xaa-Pro dipeptidase [Pseudomonadales bacterium]